MALSPFLAWSFLYQCTSRKSRGRVGGGRLRNQQNYHLQPPDFSFACSLCRVISGGTWQRGKNVFVSFVILWWRAHIFDVHVHADGFEYENGFSSLVIVGILLHILLLSFHSPPLPPSPSFSFLLLFLPLIPTPLLSSQATTFPFDSLAYSSISPSSPTSFFMSLQLMFISLLRLFSFLYWFHFGSCRLL